MKKYILPLLVAGSLLGACTNEDESIFEQSAAERLEAGQRDYFRTLCEQGGTWAMEYFSNYEEPGYVFVMQFESDKSVTIHANHKWIDGYKSEKSLWDVINDDGNVLTFNSYNTLFHVFSTPENIEGPNAPTDDLGDIDELGYGHNGDYEFMLMESDGNTIRLRGKKRGIYAYLRRLPSDTDAKTYLEQITTLSKQFDAKRFPNYIMTETSTGAQYDVTGLAGGVVSVMPLNTDNPHAQTVERACIFTTAGMRPMTAFDFIRKDNSHFTVDEFTWADDGSLVAPGVRLAAPIPAINIQRQNLKWTAVASTYSALVVDALDAANAQTKTIGGSPEIVEAFGRNPIIKNVEFGYYAKLDGKISAGLNVTLGSLTFNYFGTVETTKNGNFKLNLSEKDEALIYYILPAAPAVIDFLNLFTGEFSAENKTAMDCSVMTLTSVSNPDVYFSLKIK